MPANVLNLPRLMTWLDLIRFNTFTERLGQDAGFQLDKVQRGEEPDDSKPMPSIGAGVKEIRIWDETGTFRVIYLARLADAVYVLHCFQKKAQPSISGRC